MSQDEPIEMHVDFQKAFDIIDDILEQVRGMDGATQWLRGRIEEVKDALGYDAWQRAVSDVRQHSLDPAVNRSNLRNGGPL